MSVPKERRVSASALKTVSECTMKYYLSRVLNIPEKTWSRTHAGSAAHSILESLYRDYYRAKPRGYYAAIKAAKTIYACPVIVRLLNAWIHKTKMQPGIVADIDAMILLVINETDLAVEAERAVANCLFLKGDFEEAASHYVESLETYNETLHADH